MRPYWIISGCAHGTLLALALVTLTSSKPPEDLSNFMPVTIVTDSDLSRAPKGQENAPKLKLDDIKPLADKVDDAKSVKQQAQKVANKPEITTDAAAQQPPKPADKPDKAKAEQKPEPKPADKPDKAKAEAKAEQKPEPKPAMKPDQIAELLKKHDAKSAPKAEEKPAPAPDQKARDTPKFDPSQVAALLDKREPQRQIASAAAVSDAANLGSVRGQDAQLSQSEIDALRARISQCWNPPAGVDINSKIYVVLRVLFKPDGSLAHEPVPVEGSASSLGPALAESGKRALLMCQPFRMLKPEHYDQWRDIEVKFDPHELLGG